MNYSMENIIVVDKNGHPRNYDSQEILDAVNEAAVRVRATWVNNRLNEQEENVLVSDIENEIMMMDTNVVTTEQIHSMIEKYLSKLAPDVGKKYSDYHSSRMKFHKSWMRIHEKCVALTSSNEDEDVMTIKLQNANADSTLSSTQKCFMADYVAEECYEQDFLTFKEYEAVNDGFIYIHDRNGRNIYALNCCLFNMKYVMEHGFMINGVWTNPPSTLDKAFDVLGDLTLINSSQQYGGFTIPRIDSIIAPYAERQFDTYLNDLLRMGVAKDIAENEAAKKVEKEIYDGFQGLEMKLNTVASSRGDYPFTTFTFGLDTSKWGKIASIACLKTREGGQGEKGKKKPVLFPKLVFLYDKNLHGEGMVNRDVYEAGISCSSKCMYPDWLSLTGEGYVPSMYKKYGEKGVISPMGCRAFLSPWYEKGGSSPLDENDIPVFEGRFNIGAISLNLPLILAKAQKEGRDFFQVLDYYLEMIRQIHIRTYSKIGNMKAGCNPIAFCYGGLYGGFLKSDDKLKNSSILDSATASFGVTALNELQQQYNHKSLVEDGEFALEVMKYINKKVEEFKKEDGHLYAIYGTPAESLCSKQVKQYRSKFGVVDGVSDRDYVSNSFHCHVTEKITPIEKQDLENRFWNLFNGGKIQYCRYPLNYNINAMRTLIDRAMDLGFYEGVNFSKDYCDDCGYEQIEMGNYCPKCGSFHITQIDRMNGYLGFTRMGSDTTVTIDKNGNQTIHIRTRFQPGKNKEINDRISM